MFYLKLTSFLIIITCFANRLNCMPEEEGYDSINCSIQRKCSTSEDIVWATDNIQCYLFRNPCIFANEMCMNRDKKLNVVKQDECKKSCPDFCTEEYAPVCGEYDSGYKTFTNKCDFYRHSCQNNKSYIFLQTGECHQSTTA